MGKRERIDKKTGRRQYKSRYYWYDENGTKNDADTGWFFSKAEADKEAKRLEKQKKKVKDTFHHHNTADDTHDTK